MAEDITRREWKSAGTTRHHFTPPECRELSHKTATMWQNKQNRKTNDRRTQ